MSETRIRVLVTRAVGFIGHHLTKLLVDHGPYVHRADIKYPEYESSPAHQFELLDFRRFHNALSAIRKVGHVFALAADMGGAGNNTRLREVLSREPRACLEKGLENTCERIKSQLRAAGRLSAAATLAGAA